MFTAVFHIARNTFRENLRQPIYLLVVIAALVLISALPAFTLFVFREQEKLVTDTSMAVVLFFGWVLAVLIASHAVYQEISRGTAMLMLAKPVTRIGFLLGKTLGVLAGLAVFCFLTSIAALISLRVAADQFNFHMPGFLLLFAGLFLSCTIGGLVNFIRRTSFPMATLLAMLVVFLAAAFIYNWMPIEGGARGYSWHIVPALVLVSFAVGALGVLAVALSTRLGLLQNMLVCAVIFVIGLVSDYLFADLAERNILAMLLYGAIPNWQLFWMADALAAGKRVPISYVAWGGLYFLLFTILFLIVGTALFAHREVGDHQAR